MKTAFQKIAHFNELIGNAKNCGAVLQQFRMIDEEFTELREAVMAIADADKAVAEGDYNSEEIFGLGGYSEGIRQVRDGMADVVVTVGGLAHRMGVDIDADLEEVYRSNMSKFLLTEEAGGNEDEKSLAQHLLQVMAKLGIEAVLSETAPGVWAITSKSDQVGRDNREYPKGKLLKPSSYTEPDFSRVGKVVECDNTADILSQYRVELEDTHKGFRHRIVHKDGRSSGWASYLQIAMLDDVATATDYYLANGNSIKPMHAVDLLRAIAVVPDSRVVAPQAQGKYGPLVDENDKPVPKAVVELHNAMVSYERRQGEKPRMRMLGEAKGHPTLGDNPVNSSRVLKFDYENGLYETRNTIYKVVSWS